MADETQVAEPVQAQTQQQPDFKAELDQMMALSLNGGAAPQQQVQTRESTETTTVQEPAQQAATQGQEPVTVADPFGIFKEKFGYENPDAAVKEIEELRAFKAQPRLPQFEVPDDESGALLKAIAAGNKAEVLKHLDQEMRIERLLTSDVNKETAAEIVKMGMQLKYKDLTPDEINYRFNKQFAIPAEPKQALEEDDADFQQRVDAWKEQVTDKQMELMIEAKLAKPELQGAKVKFTIPEIETPVDEGYAQYKQMLEQKAVDDAATKEAYKALNPKAIETRINFKDEANKIDFEFQFEPDAEGFGKAVETACDADLFWKTFINSDGTPNRQKFLEAIYYVNNKEKVLMSALNQAKNATIKSLLPDNSKGGLTQQPTQQVEVSDLDRMMRASLNGYGNW